MRLALVISSNYTESSVVTAREAFVDNAKLVEWRLAQEDTGFRIAILSANRDLPEQLDATIAEHEGQLEGLLIYFSGYVAVKSDRGPALLLDGARLRAYPISRLRAALGQAAAHVHVVMDVIAMTDVGVHVASVASDVGRALHEMTPHVSVVVSAALPEHIDPARRGCTRLTDLWLLALGYEALHAKDALVFAGAVVHSLQSERISFSDLPSFDYQPSEQDFLLMPGLAVGGYSQSHSPSETSSTTERSVGAEPPGIETDPQLSSHVGLDVAHPDTYVDELARVSRPSESEEPVTPRQPQPVAAFELKLPVPPAPKVPSASASQPEANWTERASYLPSVPPPVVLPRLPSPLPPVAFTQGLAMRPESLDGSATPDDVLALTQQMQQSDQTGDSRERIEARIRLAMQLDFAPMHKARVLTQAARITLDELGDAETALELSQECLRIDLENVDAFDVFTPALFKQNRFAEIVDRCSDVLVRSLKPDLRSQASRHLLVLLETQGVSIDLDAHVIDRLRDAAGHDDELRLRVEHALRPHSEAEQTLLHIQNTLEQNPRHVQSLQVFSDMAARAGAHDTAALASAIVVCLGEARPQDEERSARLANDTLPQVSRILTDADLEENLLGALTEVAQLRALSRVAHLAAWAGLTQQSGNGKWSLPKEATVLDPAASTTTLARSLAWSAHFVNVNTPLLVVTPELTGPTELSINGESRLLISRTLGSGFSPAQLAFLGARQLCYLRPELLWRLVLGSAECAAEVIGCCVLYAQEGSEFHKSINDEQRKSAKRFSSSLDDDQSLSQLVVSTFAAAERNPVAWQSLAEHWQTVVDRAALRIGLLACANPMAAWPLITEQPQSSTMSVDEQLDEVACFAISQGHQVLRRSLGLIAE
jgi:hypothetical protein